MTTIWYVHGVGASEHSFNWLRIHLPAHEAKYLTYGITDTAEASVTRLWAAIEAEPEPVIIIGHSFGGIIARTVAARTDKIKRLVTLCAPFGGVKHVGFMTLFNDTPMFRELRTYSHLLVEVRANPIKTPHLAIVASKGLPISNDTNDGVVALSSQMALDDQDYINIALNHFEVLLSPQVAAIVTAFLEDK